MIIATAGHVDHGKTTLLQAITGVNADRLPEEKKRGMTIDLGYAYWPQPDGRVLGFIDVPGHEKFLSNMLAGVGGIDHALLVVACDDGVMAQTREHLAILQLTGNPQLTVALTKADRVDDARVSEVRETVQATCGSMALPTHRFLSPWRQKGVVSTNFATIYSTFHHALTPAITAFVWRSTGPLP
jgi:selenocysteine-specific elongation factor